ncbi:MAG: Crp/Fnr family transcriptional regulator [Deltaproteobacteria bacterium]|nr:Crp/Fnr family transcriptional regulator [Deltaproteobacteria bacterium]
MRTFEQMAKIPLLEGLPSGQLNDLASIAIEKTFPRGATIFSEGEEAGGFYVATEGRVKIFKLSPDGKEQIIHIFGPREPFGEVPVFEGGRFPAHCEALERTVTLYFPRAAFVALIKDNPALALNMLAILSRRLRIFLTLVDNLSLKEVPGRLAAHLLYLSDREQGTDTLELDISKGQLASLLGTIPETLSRILTKMSKNEIIDIDGRRVHIRDREALKDLAEGLKRL